MMIMPRYLQIVIYFFGLISIVLAVKCNLVEVLNSEQCSENEACVVVKESLDEGACECKIGYSRTSPEDQKCVKNTLLVVNDEGGTNVAAAILIPLFLIVVVIIGVYYSRKYNLIGWVRYKINQRYNSNYDDVMIGQDDD